MCCGGDFCAQSWTQKLKGCYNLGSVAKSTLYYVFADQSWPAESITTILPSRSSLGLWIEGRGWLMTPNNGSSFEGVAVDSAEKAAGECKIPEASKRNVVAILGFEDVTRATELEGILKSRSESLQVLKLGTRTSKSTPAEIRRSVAWKDLMETGFAHELELLAIQSKIVGLQSVLEDANRVAILLQDDPDPDGLAGALALRKILGRNAQTAPIVSFGKITRPENLAMVQLLEIEVERVTEKTLNAYDKIAFVDCQPSFFKDRDIRCDVVIDHHPRSDSASLDLCEWIEIDEELGSIATLFTFFLKAAGVEISQRLATALLYGIKTDTLFLNRGVSAKDLEAFVSLYPKVNGALLRRIERPDLPLKYIDSLRRSLKSFKPRGGVGVLIFPEVKSEDWIPQAADFISQIEDVRVAAAGGIVEDNIVISGRNWDPELHCGEIFKENFDRLGSAGGHKSMAKALIPLTTWKHKFGDKALSQSRIKQIVQRLLARGVARQLKDK
jgi:nanoRNase/pAp phosphatase (c-di-AMP/oligoRNAs hydrolase)